MSRHKLDFWNDIVQLGAPVSNADPRSLNLEQLAAEFHAVYQDEARRQGDIRHAEDYEDLPENVKEFDRALARHVLGRLGRQRLRIVEQKTELARLADALEEAEGETEGLRAAVHYWREKSRILDERAEQAEERLRIQTEVSLQHEAAASRLERRVPYCEDCGCVGKWEEGDEE